ncbi:multi-sensor hybrid histidine kinase [Calothrix sp. NIES-4071]|nr:multi-sensor hybrid histidine kinase [Calothrix sp. NIES-4071]BAZ59969.1 multi-sensor hybrid histidine kinase [Calothrix sp. NIES-4105]
MNTLLSNLFFVNLIEYLTICENYKIVEASSNVKHFSDNPNQVKQGSDIRISFPELTGTEEILNDILQGTQNHFNIDGVSRSFDDLSPLYIDIHIIKNIKANSEQKELMILIVDSTERMVMEQSLMQSANQANLLLRNLTASKQYIEQILTSMSDAMITTTPSGNIKRINPATLVLLEYEETEIIGRQISTLFKGIEAAEESEVEASVRTKSGKTIPVAVSCSMLQTDIEHFQGYVYIVRDMSERKSAELAKQQFMAMISHEIRTPITSVTGMATLLLNTKMTSEQRDFVETIYTSGIALHKIINDILDFSKIEAGKLELEAQPFEVRRCIDEAINLLAPSAKEKALKLRFVDTSDTPKMVVGDVTRVRQILVNLISNAIKFTNTGSIEVCVNPITTSNTETKSNTIILQVSVKDTGVGIEAAQKERLFKVFSQVNSSITRQYGGTGLGLAICKQLCELMGGTIWVESEKDKGSTFYFTIEVEAIPEDIASTVCRGAEPLTVQDLDIISDAKIDLIAQEHPLKILLVEDHAINQRMIKLMLQRMGYEPAVANNGLEALNVLRTEPYDVVLMDMQMPEMDGLTAAKHIQQEWAPVQRPAIIALTASTMWEQRERCLGLGIDDYLSKPIRIGELVEALKKCRQLDIPIYNSNTHYCIDSKALQEILNIANFNSTINAKKFVVEIIDLYLDDAPKLLQGIQEAHLQTNLKNLQRLSHTLGSTSATLGATYLGELCKQVEEIAAPETLIGIEEKLNKIEAEYQQVQIALLSERQKYT